MDVASDYITTLKARRWIYLVSTPLGMLNNICGLIFVMAQVIFSPSSWGEGMTMRRNTLLHTVKLPGKEEKTIIIHFFCRRQERRNNQETNLLYTLCAECPMFNLTKYTYTKKAQPLFCRSLSLKPEYEGQTSVYLWLHNEILRLAALGGPVGSFLLFTESLLPRLLVVEQCWGPQDIFLPPTPFFTLDLYQEDLNYYTL